MLGKNNLQEMPTSSKGPLIIAEIHKGFCPMLVIIHFRKYYIWNEKKKITDQSNFVNDVT